MKLSNNNILSFGTYNLLLYTLLIIVVFLVRNLLKRKKYILRFGMFFAFFVK